MVLWRSLTPQAIVTAVRHLAERLHDDKRPPASGSGAVEGPAPAASGAPLPDPQ